MRFNWLFPAAFGGNLFFETRNYDLEEYCLICKKDGFKTKIIDLGPYSIGKYTTEILGFGLERVLEISITMSPDSRKIE